MSPVSRFLGLAASLLVLSASAPPSAPPAGRWEIEILPVLETPVGDLLKIVGRDLNELGQVAGTAGNSSTAAFRYTPGVGMEDLDPDGRYRSRVPIGGVMNDRGHVFGMTHDASGQSDVFLYTDARGFRRLPRGKTDEIRRGFSTFGGQTGIPDAGHLCGYVRPADENLPTQAFVYLPRKGWTNLADLHPRFASEHTYCTYTNERGDLTLAIPGRSAPGVEPAYSTQEVFVRIGRAPVVRLPTEHPPVSVVGELNSTGMLPGVHVVPGGGERAYVWDPERGFEEIHPAGMRESAALYASDDSRVWGILRKGRYWDHVFSYTSDEGLDIELRRKHFKRIARRHDRTFRGVSSSQANNVGTIVGDVRDGERNLPFFYSRESGLVDLKRVIDRLRADFDPHYVAALNDRNEILLVGETSQPAPRLTSAIMRRR